MSTTSLITLVFAPVQVVCRFQITTYLCSFSLAKYTVFSRGFIIQQKTAEANENPVILH